MMCLQRYLENDFKKDREDGQNAPNFGASKERQERLVQS